MIIAIIGDIGSGKSVTATKKILDSNLPCFVNFNITSKRKNLFRLKKKDIITSELKGVKKSGEEIIEHKVNWDFWNKALFKHKNYNICLDEVHNIIHSRQSMSKFNILASIWISQIRKILGDSEISNIYLITQKLMRLDTAWRDLLNAVIFCKKYEDYSRPIPTLCYQNNKLVIKILPSIYIINHYFIGMNCDLMFNNFALFNEKTYTYRTSYLANPYFQYYNSFELFGETAYL